jgi:hypothetical protein
MSGMGYVTFRSSCISERTNEVALSIEMEASRRYCETF